MKKLIAIVLAGAITLSLSSVAMAAQNGKSAAPGQASNFYKGVTTDVTISEEIATPHVTTESKNVNEIRLTGTQVISGTPVVTTNTVVDYNNIVGTVTHPEFPWTANLYATTVTTTTTTPNKQVDTYASFDVKYERTVSTYYKIQRTIQHHGAPCSNGKVISDVSEEIVTRVVYGNWTEVSKAEIADTAYTVETKLADTIDIATTKTTTQGEWSKPQGTPSTISQGSKSDEGSKTPGADPISKK